jgi:hypothetical protein
MKIRAAFLIVSLTSLLLGPASAALVWEQKEADLHPALTDKTAVAHFKYKNTGDKPVKITSVHASCGCTTAALAKETVAPDESGEIVATFTIGERSGVQTKTITVKTDDQPEQATILKLKATIPQLLQVSPAFLFWSAKDALVPKVITVDVGAEYSVDKITVTSTDKSIETEVEKVPDKKEFHVIVKPTESGRPINAALKIEPVLEADAHKPYYANVRIDSRAKPSPQ